MLAELSGHFQSPLSQTTNPRAAEKTMATSTQAVINRYLPDGGKFVGNVLTLVAALASVAVTLYTRYPPEQAVTKIRHRAIWLLPVVGRVSRVP